MGRVSKVQGVEELMPPRLRVFHTAKRCGLIAGMLLLTGCATHASRQVTYAPVSLAQPKSEISESDLLGVRITPFDPGELPENAKGLSKQIRTAEGYYAAVLLKKALQESGYWGPVRVVPSDVAGGEVTIKGRIVESDGEVLKLAVRVQDATGALWSEKQYDEVVDVKHYEESENGGEPFRFLYVRLANDMAQIREKLTRQQINSIRHVAELKFAEDVAPESFKGYLSFKDAAERGTSWLTLVQAPANHNLATISQLPANDDPIFASVKRIRISEEGVIDTFDLQHDDLARKVTDPYTQWRVSRLKEINAVRKVESKRNQEVGKAVAIGVGGVLVGVALGALGGRCYSCFSAAGAVVGATTGAAVQLALRASEQATQESEIHRAALEELGESLSQDMKVTVVQVQGDARELKGTADEQFKQWRILLKEIHEREVGPAQAKP